jgi:two-component system alkaline phosphatase synthesis response regulator PhoP
VGIDDRRETGTSALVTLAAPRGRRVVRLAELWPASDLHVYRFGSVEADFRRAEVTRNGDQVPLAAKEFLLLRYFVEHRGMLLTRNELLDGVWGYDAMPVTRTVDVHVAWLRKKLEPQPHHPRFILTMHRLGYKFVG